MFYHYCKCCMKVVEYSWSDSCSNRLLLQGPTLSLATGILYNFHTAFAIMVKHSCLCLVTWNISGQVLLLWWHWRSDSCRNWLLYYKDPHLSLTTGILKLLRTAFAVGKNTLVYAYLLEISLDTIIVVM